jgi:hypothetical protein
MTSIGPGEKAAILEALDSAVSLVPEDLRGDFVLVGGAALLTLGGNRKTWVGGTCAHEGEYLAGTGGRPRSDRLPIPHWENGRGGDNFKGMVLAPGDGEELGDAESLTTVGKAAGGYYSTLLQGMLPM